jgi:hypothetical protein
MYLCRLEFLDQWQAERDALRKRRPINATKTFHDPARHNQQNEESVRAICNGLLSAFNRLQYHEFFELWERSLPSSTRSGDAEAQKMEFYIHIYFAISPWVKKPKGHGSHNNNNNRASLEKDKQLTSERFRRFLESQGKHLSQTTEFLPFYALPYVPDPSLHPSFAAIFKEGWALQLSQRLERFVRKSLKQQTIPVVYTILKRGDGMSFCVSSLLFSDLI